MKTPLEHLYRRPGYLIKRCHQVAAALFVSHCRDFGITPSQYGALCALREFPGIDQLAVGRLIGLDRSTAGLVIKLLAERGLVERSVNDQDNRRMQLRLSPVGEEFLNDVEPAARRAQEYALAALPGGKRGEFLELLESFLRGHGAIIDPADVMAGKPSGSQFDALISSRSGIARTSGAKPESAPGKPRRSRA